MKTISMTEAKNDICAIIRDSEGEDVVITRHGKPAAVVIGFQNDDDWFDYRLENDERFLRKIAQARADIRAGRYITLEDLEKEEANKASLRSSALSAARAARLRNKAASPVRSVRPRRSGAVHSAR